MFLVIDFIPEVRAVSQVAYFETDQSTISASFLGGDSKVSHLFIAESHLLSYKKVIPTLGIDADINFCFKAAT